MGTSPLEDLQGSLGRGLAVVQELWYYTARNWITGIHGADIDNDGDYEIAAASREGRVYILTKRGALKWERIVGNKAWIGSVMSVPAIKERNMQARILVGDRDGKVYVLDKDNNAIDKYGKRWPYAPQNSLSTQGHATEPYWLDTQQAICQVYVDSKRHNTILVGSEDRHVYVLDYKTGELRWKYETSGWVRNVLAYDINKDGQDEILVGSVDKNLYIFTPQGKLSQIYSFDQALHTLGAADINHDGSVEILVGTDGKELYAFTPDFAGDKCISIHAKAKQTRWSYRLDNRPLTLIIADIDGDGKSEILVGSEDQHIYVLDEHGKLIWRHNLASRVFSLYAQDIDNDGIMEVFAGAEDKKVHALRFTIHKNLEKTIRQNYVQAFSSPDSSLSRLSKAEQALLQDILKLDDSDKKPVRLSQARKSLKEGNYLAALLNLLYLEQRKVQRLWVRETSGYIRTVSLGDISGDPRHEIIVGTSNGSLEVFTNTGTLLWKFSLEGQIIATQTGYLDRGKRKEIVACTVDQYTSIISGVDEADLPQPTRLRHTRVDGWILSVCLKVTSRVEDTKILVGTEDKKILIYGTDLGEPEQIIETAQGIKIIQACELAEEGAPEIIAGCLDNCVYAYTQDGLLLWTYQVYDRIRALCMQDIDGDNDVEILVGSEDRNVYVLSSKGTLKWRYFLPHDVLAVSTTDINQDGKSEILAGCADSYLYVFSSSGDLLWKYRSNDRIRSVCSADVNQDREREIALGSEDKLELLQIVRPQILAPLIEQCWRELQNEKTAREWLRDFLHAEQAVLRAFAVRKYGEQADLCLEDCVSLCEMQKDDAIEVRQALIASIITIYPHMPAEASVSVILEKLATDNDLEVQLSFIEHLHTLVRHDREMGFYYLERLSRNNDKFIRRAVARKLYQIIDEQEFSDEQYVLLNGRQEKVNAAIFSILLTIACNTEAAWSRQEAARTLAYYLDQHYERLIIYLYILISKGVAPAILLHMAHNASTPIVQHTLQAIVALLDEDLNDDNVQQRVLQGLQALSETKELKYGTDYMLVYQEFYHLFKIRTIPEMAHYRCTLSPDQFTSVTRTQAMAAHQYIFALPKVFERLGSITRNIKIYLRRDILNDRLSSLLEANDSIQKMRKFIDNMYISIFSEEFLCNLPDKRLFAMLLTRWEEMIKKEITELRGKPELQAELQTRSVHYEDQIGVLLRVNNRGRSTAHNVKVSLLHSTCFSIVNEQSFETEAIAGNEEIEFEFSIKTQPAVNTLELCFDINYDDPDNEALLGSLKYCERLSLNKAARDFKYIDINPYSFGTPIQDSKMFYGREKDIAHLKDCLTRTSAKTVILYGQRRSGKTTLLLYMEKTAVLQEHIPVFIDMQGLAYNISDSKLFLEIACAIYTKMQRKGFQIKKPVAQDFVGDPTPGFNRFLDEAEVQIGAQKIIILIDEFEVIEEQVKRGALQPELFQYLRSLMQHRPKVNFLLSGMHTIEELTREYWAVFFNIAYHYQLSKLSEKAATELITGPVIEYLDYDALAVKKVRNLTGNQPYLIHLFCHMLIEQCNEMQKTYVTINDVNMVTREVMQTGQFHIETIWNMLSRTEQIMLAMMATLSRQEGRALSLYEIEEGYRDYHLFYDREQLPAMLKTLCKIDVVECIEREFQEFDAAGKRYIIPIGLIRRWLLRERPLDMLLQKQLEDSYE